MIILLRDQVDDRGGGVDHMESLGGEVVIYPEFVEENKPYLLLIERKE